MSGCFELVVPTEREKPGKGEGKTQVWGKSEIAGGGGQGTGVRGRVGPMCSQRIILHHPGTGAPCNRCPGVYRGGYADTIVRVQVAGGP